MGRCLAELGDGAVQFHLLLRQVLLVESEQLLAFSVLLLQAWREEVEEGGQLSQSTSGVTGKGRVGVTWKGKTAAEILTGSTSPGPPLI